MTSPNRQQRSFGPIVIHEDGMFRASCAWCCFRIGQSCTFAKGHRVIPDIENTPEFCEMRGDMLREAGQAAGRRLDGVEHNAMPEAKG